MNMTKTTVSSAENKECFPWVYFHGKAEELLGCDLVAVDQGMLGHLGERDIIIRDNDFNAHEGVSYLYQDGVRLRGYITLADDIEAREAGQRLLDQKPSLI